MGKPDDFDAESTARLPPSPEDILHTVESPSTLRLFNTQAFFRLWLAQVVSSLGDWLGFLAITAVAARVGGSSPEAAISLVLSARLVPGFFLAPVAGVMVDRWDRKRVMVVCSLGRAAVLAFVPFVDTVAGLVLASFLLEVFTLTWSPAKEASVPNIVRPEFIANANSLSLVAAYGTFPLGGVLFALSANVAVWLGNIEALSILQVNQEMVAIYLNVVTFVVSALLISTLALPRQRTERRRASPGWRSTLRELREAWRYIGTSPVVRSVMLGLATGLFGGGMLVPLGPIFSRDLLGGGTAGFGALLSALGFGVAAGIIGVSVVQRRLPHERVFVGALFGAGSCIILGASMSSLGVALVFVGLLGVCAGAVYILGFTILQTNVDDELRGRIFATLYTLIRFCALLAFAVAPILARLMGSLYGGQPGTRLALWFGGAVILGAGVLSLLAMRPRQRV